VPRSPRMASNQVLTFPSHVLWVLESDLCPAGYTQGHPSLTGNQGVGIGPQVMFRFIVPFHN